MLETIEVWNAAGDSLTFPLEDVVTGYPVESVEGLDPVRAVLVSSSFATQDGSQYQTARREERDIKLNVKLEPNYATNETVRSLRSRLYEYFMTKTRVTLKFALLDGLLVQIVGYVETCEAAIFSQEPGMSILVRCFDPDFIDPTAVVVSGETVEDMTELTIPYVGTVETGVEFTLNVDRDLSEFTIYHRPPDGSTRTMNFEYDLEAGDVLKISTVKGNKYLTLTRSGVTTSVLNGMDPTSSWTEFQRGDNHIRVYAVGDGIPYTISYTTRYGGL